MSGLIYLFAAVLLAAVGLGILWLIENAPHRDPLKGVDEFDRARRALRRRHRAGVGRGGGRATSGQRERSDKGDAREAPTTVKILR